MVSLPKGHSAAERIMSMKNSNDTIGNWTRDLPARGVMHPSTLYTLSVLETAYIFLADTEVFALLYCNTEGGRIYRNTNLAYWNTKAG
jgi:hypothetical protein